MKKYLIGLAVVAVVGFIVALPAEKSAPTVSQPTKSYVALGDSVAAGVGLKTDSDSSACDRTNESYPNQVATALHYKLKNLACSGATLPAGILGPQDVNQLALASQLTQLFSQPKPELISLTVGANDINWTSIIGKCYTAECGGPEDTANVTMLLNVVNINLNTALTQIQNHYKAAVPKVIITGYHQVFPSDSTACADLTGIDAAELHWGRQQQASLSDTIKQATNSFSFASFTPVDFSGHELCTPDSWVQGLYDKQPYHPTQAGQTAFAKQIIAAAKQAK